MNIKEMLERFFEHYKKQISIDEIIKFFKVKNEGIEKLLDSLFELEKEGKIFFDKNGTYMHKPLDFLYQYGILRKSHANQYYIKTKENNCIIIKNTNGVKEGDVVFVSILDGKKNHPKQFFGNIERIVKRESLKTDNHFIIKATLKKDGMHFYVNVKDERVYIPKENLNTAFAGDLVNVQVKNHTGNIIEVLKRHQLTHVFRCVENHGEIKWAPISSSYGFYDLDCYRFKEGDLIQAEIKNNKLKLIKKLEMNHSVNDDINALIVEYGFVKEFPKQVLESAKKIKATIDDDALKDRRDLRNLETFTIDPVDAKDLDDAISLEYEDGKYYLYVHAVNPSYYVKLGSPIFNEAFKRGFSVYPSNGVIPMLPDSLSSEICSLNENGDKLALTCKMVIDCDGKMVDCEIFKSIIHNDKQMNYDDVNDYLDYLPLSHEYAPFRDTLLKMKDLAILLQKNKTKRGSITFEGEERKFILDSSGNPVMVQERQRGVSQLIIENFMLIANESVSRFAYYLNLPFIYRNHDKPTVQKKNNLKSSLHQKGYVIQKVGNIDNPEFLQRVLISLLKGKTKEEKKVICEVFLKSMTRAFYDYKNIGHYGLALDCYGTFTSPARKISDFINHMVLDEFLTNGIDSLKLSLYKDFIEDSCEYISEKQKDADLLEQEMDAVLLSRYASNFLNVDVKAKILFVNRYGIYVKDSNGLTGVIPLSKDMRLSGQKVIYQGYEYKADDQVTVTLKERRPHELVYVLHPVVAKKLIKKK